MKKIFTLLLSVGALTASFAQSGHSSNNKKSNQYITNTEYKKIDSHRDNIYTFPAKERDIQIDKINNSFNLKVKSIISNRRIEKSEKRVLIQKARVEKDQQIQAVNAKFNSKFNTAFNNHEKQNDSRKHLKIKSPLAGFFYVRQACMSAIGCKSRIRLAVGSISQEQGCPS